MRKIKEKIEVKSTSVRFPKIEFFDKMKKYTEEKGMNMTRFLIKSGLEYMEKHR